MNLTGIKRSILSSCMAAAAFTSPLAPQVLAYEPSPEILQAREEFRDHGFGIFIHWGIYSMLGSGEWVLNDPNIYHNEYKDLASGFYPSEFDAAAWVKAIKASGAKYICITTRHHDGFSMFATKHSPYNIVDATPFKRDIIKEIADECEKQGVALHFYYSQLDWGRPDYNPIGRTGHEPDRDTSEPWTNYLDFMDAQLTELLTNYGKIGAIWYDGMWDRDELPGGLEPSLWNLDHQYALIHSLQPSCLVGNNHHMTPFAGEDIQIFERDKPGENEAGLSGQDVSALPLETCQTMNNSWGYRIRDNEYKSANELIQYLVGTAGRDANLLLNIGPRPDGSIPPQALERLAAIGEWMQTYAPTVQGVRGGPVAPQQWGVTTRRDNKLYVHVFDRDASVIFIPYAGNKLKVAKEYAGEPVKYTQTPEGIILTLSKTEESMPDRVYELTFKNKIQSQTQVR